MSWVAGIDYSSHAIDIALVDEDDLREPLWFRYELQGADAFDRTRMVRTWQPGPLFYDCVACGIEDPRGYSTGALFRVQGAILARLPEKLLVHPLIPSVWRKQVGLKGNATKDDVAAWALHRLSVWPVRAKWWTDAPQDALDAYGVAEATRGLLERKAAA